MSLRQDVQAVAMEKSRRPYTLSGYRLVADFDKSEYRVVLRYDHERQETRFVTRHFTKQREAIECALRAEKSTEVPS